MTKPKNKTQRNFFQYFVDEFILFRRDFRIESNLTTKACAKVIQQNLSHKELPARSPHKPIVKASISEKGETYKFIMWLKQRQQYNYLENASAKGVIHNTTGQQTIIEGTAQMTGWMAWVFILLFIGIAFTIPMSVNSSSDWFINLFVVFLGLGFWWSMYQDRNQLITLIMDAIQLAEEEQSMSRLQNEDISSSSAYEAVKVTHKSDNLWVNPNPKQSWFAITR